MSHDCCRGDDPDCWECNYFHKRLPGDGKTQAARDWEWRRSHTDDGLGAAMVPLGFVAIVLWLLSAWMIR